MWRRSENGNAEKPLELDTISSKRWNYVRKDFELIPTTEEKPEHWEYNETKILKDDWETYSKVLEHNIALDDVYAALTELAEMILEV